MSQPYNRAAQLPPLGELDGEIGEFWIGNPWGFHGERKNLSCYERNRLFVNDGDLRFYDASYLSGTDSEGDGRSSVAADLNRDGMLELIVRQVGGGSLLVFENQFPRKRFLTVLLRGIQSNRAGVGATVMLKAGGQVQTREMFPANSFMSQSPSEVHFGLGEAEVVEQLRVHWPSGVIQEFHNLPSDKILLIQESYDSPHIIAAR